MTCADAADAADAACACAGYGGSHVAARWLGQLLGFGVSLWICLYARLPPLAYRVEQPLTVLFALEAIGTALEHMAVVYVILPLLPPAHTSSAAVGIVDPDLRILGVRVPSAKVKPKSHADAQAPSNPMVLHAALVFGGLHWCLSRGFCIEMTPLTTVTLAVLRSQPPGADVAAVWAAATLALWAQAVGVAVCVAYVALFAPRETKFWPGMLHAHAGAR